MRAPNRDPGPPYLSLDLPERFELQFFENGSWWGEAQCRAAHFNRNDDGSYAGGAGGSPIWLRCIAKHPEHFVHVDGTGALFVYRLLRLPMERGATDV